MRRLLVALAVLASSGAGAAMSVDVCFNYGCASTQRVALPESRLADIAALLASAEDAETERHAIATAIGMMHSMAGEDSPISADRAGNYLDAGVPGRMDCIDHSTTTTRLLELIESRGWLRFHRVVEPARRTLAIFQHFSAVIEEMEPLSEPPREPPPAAPLAAEGEVPDHVPLLLALCDCQNVVEDIPRKPEPETSPVRATGRRFAVDSWFVEHGEPAVVLPLAEWMNGEGPNVQ